MLFRKTILAAALIVAFCATDAAKAEPKLKLEQGNHISYIGNTLADRMQHDGWLETYIQAVYPDLNLSFRNLGFAGDEINTRPRSANFGSPDEWLAKCKTDVVFCFFGYNEALKGEAGVEGFKNDLAKLIDGMHGQKYNGKSAPQIVVFSPIAHEDLKNRLLPDGSENNAKLELYTAAMKTVCESKRVLFVDLFHPTQRLYTASDETFTMNGVHLKENGNKAVAQTIMRELFDGAKGKKSNAEIEQLRQAVLDKNYHWFSRYRVVDGYNVFGGRSKLNWHGQSNFDVMQQEMVIFDVMTANRDKGVWSVAAGGKYDVDDSNLPKNLAVKSNRTGPKEDGTFPYIGAEEAIEKMTIAKGMKVNVFASEEMFPEFINPVQVAVDTDSRLWVSVWPSYPHWNPSKPREDKIVILPDEDGDGVADRCITFADGLNSVTGFEFWGGGVLVAAAPEIWFLKDTDGDDKADLKIRMLQGVSSADSHHTANAMVIGADGGLYWSRGVFHVTNMETPTKTFRSTASGVYRFDPRTYEIDFHFPIGPNPHGDVIDKWGYQFANDGTSGTGSYVNIGHGVNNKKWFQKRVRPVPATGILSSSVFPEENNNNFLICNAIGFLGVLQHEVNYDGADITATEIEPIVYSSDPNFRPSDVEVGGDGALYIADWHNALIGHMQHNIRDPNRDETHGRVYRVTYEGGKLVKPVKMKNKPVAEVCENFFAYENATRYRARLELTGRSAEEATNGVAAFAAKLNPKNASTARDEAQALLECLWVFEEQRVPNMDLLTKVFQADEPRVRAAAIRTLGHWAGKVDGWEDLIVAAARDQSALVRAEAVKAAVWFEGVAAAEVIFEAATRPMDPEMDAVLKYARSKINVDQLVQEAIAEGKPLSLAAQTYALRNASVADLLKMDRTEAVYRTILTRSNVNMSDLQESLSGLAKITKSDQGSLLFELLTDLDSKNQGSDLSSLGKLLLSRPVAELRQAGDKIQALVKTSQTIQGREVGYAAWIVADGNSDAAFKYASSNKTAAREFLAATGRIDDAKTLRDLYENIRKIAIDPPKPLMDGDGSFGGGEPGIHVDFFQPHSSDCKLETLAKRKPKVSGTAKEISLNVPQRKAADGFTLRFSGNLRVPASGKYTFYTNSDDGSRLYINDKSVVDNDGNHGPVEKSGSVQLTSGIHKIMVSYFDSGGGDGLSVQWAGPQLKKQTIDARYLSVAGAETLQDIAIGRLANLPGHESQKIADLSGLILSDKYHATASKALLTLDEKAWEGSSANVGGVAQTLAKHVSTIPAKYRTSKDALAEMELVDRLANRLPDAEKQKLQAAMADLAVRVIRIGTVKHRMIYDKEVIAVQAGKPVEFVLSNTDNMPHNFTIVPPGAMEEVGLLAESTARDKTAEARQYVPTTDKIMIASNLLQTGDTQALSFVAPTEEGVYPYVCTYPGHWRRMYGAMYVVKDLKAYTADPAAYVAAHKIEIKDELLQYQRNKEWVMEDLEESLADLHKGRSFDVGKKLFAVASCVACHKLNGEGRQIGADLSKLEPKYTAKVILESILEPSKEINEKYQSYAFVIDDGRVVTGLIKEETPTSFVVINNPGEPEKTVEIKKSQIEERAKSKNSLMPKGLLNKLTREEILDLIGYVTARGDAKNAIYKDGHKH